MPLPQFPNQDQSSEQRDFGGGYNSRDVDTTVADNELTGGQNIIISPDKSLAKRKGHTLHGNYIGSTTGVQGLIVHTPQGGTAEFLAGYDTGIYRYVAGVWTALTSVTMTTARQLDFAYYPLTSKTYIVNGTDSVVKYTSGTAGDQSDSSFKKGKYIIHFKNRLLVANVTSQTDYVWYTDLGVDTFSGNNYFRVEGEITGLEVLYDKVLIFTKKKVYVLNNFTFNGLVAGPESVYPLATDFGAIYDRTIVKVGNLVYFLGQDAEGLAAVYATDGLYVGMISDKISPDLNDLSASHLTNACAGPWGRYYRCSVTPSGQTTNTKEYLFDTVAKRWLPPFTNAVGGFSCYAVVETSGQLDLYAGTQGQGQVYKLNQVDYDEVADESYTTTGSYDGEVNANPAKRHAQSFQLSDYPTDVTVPVNSLWLRLKKNTGTTTNLTVRVETDNNGNPSGTLAHASATATITAFSSTAYTYYEADITGTELSGDTTYWIVLKHATEGTGDSKYYWGGNGTSPTYASGNASVYVGTTSSTSETFNPGATAVDGYVSYHDSSGGVPFSSVRGGTGNGVSDNGVTASVFLAASASTDLYTDLARSYVLFDTSSLPDDAVVTAATLSVYCTFVSDNLTQSLGVTAGTPASNTALVTGDYATASFGSTKFATDLTLASLTANAYNTFTLNASGRSAITVSGVTKFAIRLVSDIENSAPTWSSDGFTVVTFNTVESANPPRLSITYSSAGGVATWTSDAAKDLNFLLYSQSAIDGFANTKAFYYAPQGQATHLREVYVTTEATGDYNLQVGVNTGEFAGFDYQDFLLSENAPIFGSTLEIGESALGSRQRTEGRIRFPGKRGKTFKYQFRNRFANQPWTVYGYRTRHQVVNKIK